MLPPQSMHLNEQVQDQGDAFVVYAKVLLQLSDQLRPDEIDLGETQVRFALPGSASPRKSIGRGVAGIWRM
jgi:hypothetical protein